MLIKLVLVFMLLVHSNAKIKTDTFFDLTDNGLETMQHLMEDIMVRNLLPYKCVIIITDGSYGAIFNSPFFHRFSLFISFLTIQVQDSDDLLAPSPQIQQSLLIAKAEDCQMYIVLLSNGLQLTRFLRFGDKYRILNTRSKFVFLNDNRLFEKTLFYLWRRIINVVFIRQYEGRFDSTLAKNVPWFELSTVPFPSPITSVLVPRRLDIWAKSKFRKGVDLFRDKTADLRNQTLKVAAFAHIPGTTKLGGGGGRTVRAQIGDNATAVFTGTEIEILQTVADAMNFRCDIYEPANVDRELWGEKQASGKYSGLIGEMTSTHADIALGDLYYTTYILNLMDLTVPYNTECLTFLTPESLTDNSWKTLILPFKSLMWAAVLVFLLVSGVVFYVLAYFHESIARKEKIEQQVVRKKQVVTVSIYGELDSDVKYTMMREQYKMAKGEGEPVGLYQFSDPVNSLLYTYSMLLLVSLPKLPTGWSLRMLTGWYWLYCLLLVVSYRASMTAILARPTPRVTIDTFQELIDSRLACGGWGDINKEFFKTSLDPTINRIAENFEMVNDSSEAVDRVVEGTFAFYENAYFLKEALVKRQLRYQALHALNKTMRARAREDRGLHIMTDCVIKMPISIGLQKNSPIKPRIDKFVRRVLEAGLIKKWLDDVMSPILAAEVQTPHEQTKAIMNMRKFFGALVALFIGYFISIVGLIVEVGYFHFVVKKNPNYNKYSRSVCYGKKKSS